MKHKSINESYRILLLETIQFFESYSFKTKTNILSLSNNDFHLLIGIKSSIIKMNKTPKIVPILLTNEQLKLFIVILDWANKKFINEFSSPYSKYEMGYFHRSEKFIKQYNKFGDPENILKIIQNNKQFVYV